MAKDNCLICGRLSEEIFCENCSEQGWEKHRAIKKFLEDYPGSTVIEVCREISVSVGFIKGLVKEGYLNLNLPK